MSFVRSSSAWQRVPLRWKLAGGSAVLTLTILAAFAAGIGLLAGRQISGDFRDQVRRAADDLVSRLQLEVSPGTRRVRCAGVDLDDYATAERARVRVMLFSGTLLCGTGAADLGPPRVAVEETGGYRIESRSVPIVVNGVAESDSAIVQYARPLSAVRHTIQKVRLMLLFGVFAGAALAGLAGLLLARRATRPIVELTAAAREIQRTRDPGRRIAVPEAADEVRELARTLDEMLLALDSAQTETEEALARQRRFVADASHELRTPLTSVLANLELLAAELDGEQRETARSALRSTHRMRRLVADLLLLARADSGRLAPRREVDLAKVLVEAAGELGPLAEDHELEVDVDGPAWIAGAPDELHRLVLNLLQNAVAHTPSGTHVAGRVRAEDGGDAVVLEVSDDGPGVPEELVPRIFDRFVRGAGDTGGGGTGLGLAIVRAVAESHGGTVALGAGSEGGARFSVRLPGVVAPVPAPAAR